MAKKKTPRSRGKQIEAFDYAPGRVLARKYEVVSKLGQGWEAEVYMVKEIRTGIVRAAKIFFPHRNENNKVSKFYARKLHKLRDCPILIQYHTEESITFRSVPVTMLVSEYVDGELLSDFLARQPGKRISVFQGLHLLHALAAGLGKVHAHREYHGDLHSENVMIHRCGLGFDLKVLDFFHWQMSKKENIEDDVCDLIKLFYDSIGGQKRYHKHPPEVKAICCGLKRTLILKKFRNATKLRQYLETMQWH